jgi:hypothetical protein
LQCNDASSSYIATDGLSANLFWCQILIFLYLTIFFFSVWGALTHIPHVQGDPAQSQVKVTLVQGEIFKVTIGRAEKEAYSAMWNLGTNSAFALGPRKTTENIDRVGRLQDLPDAD